MPQGKGTYGSQRGRPPSMARKMLERARETTDKLSPMNPLRMLREQAQKIKATGNKKNTYRETMGLDDFKSAFARAKKAGKKTFEFKGKKFTTKTRDEAVKAFQRLIAKHGSSPEQVEKSAREIRISHGIPHPKKEKKQSGSKRKNTQVAKN